MIESSVFSKLNSSTRKGENGTILIIGGSERYSGAPTFTALGALRSGSDLVYVFTDEHAVNIIKSTPEIIVLPMQLDHFILDKITACVVGPGLGRLQKDKILIIQQIVDDLDKRNIPFVFDADAIHYYKHDIFNQVKICVLTPNYKEAKELKVKGNHYCIYKGETDMIKFQDRMIGVDISASLKRCGGQGDILSGIVATSLSIEKDDVFKACVSSCTLMRKSSHLAYLKKGFSLITSDIFESLSFELMNITKSNEQD